MVSLWQCCCESDARVQGKPGLNVVRTQVWVSFPMSADVNGLDVWHNTTSYSGVKGLYLNSSVSLTEVTYEFNNFKALDLVLF